MQDNTSVNSRGRGGKASLIEAVQTQFDMALMQIDIEGPDSDVRKVISSAQDKLQQLRLSQDADACAIITAEMQGLVQDAVSQLNGRSFRLEGRAP